MSEKRNTLLPPIPTKRYFTIGEVSELCDVKPHVLRYWEQEFTQLRPVKRRGNRRYYQRHEVLLIRQIRQLLYDEGFTIHGARSRLDVSHITQLDLDNDQQAALPGMDLDSSNSHTPEIIENTPTLLTLAPTTTLHTQIRTQLIDLLTLLEKK